MDKALPERTEDWSVFAAELIEARQTVLPWRLTQPGPDPEQLARILGAAAAAPDHRSILPWRFIAVPDNQRTRLAQAFAQALLQRDPTATPEDVARAREKADRSPFLALVVLDTGKGDACIGADERLISAGCALQNVLLMATAIGFGSALTAGQAIHSEALRALFGLAPSERAVCFLSIGTAASHRASRVRPVVADYFSTLADSST